MRIVAAGAIACTKSPSALSLMTRIFSGAGNTALFRECARLCRHGYRRLLSGAAAARLRKQQFFVDVDGARAHRFTAEPGGDVCDRPGGKGSALGGIERQGLAD